jgi:DNA-binding CsgD family transcriptional regulator
VPRYTAWPQTGTFKANWPKLAPDLIEASFLIVSAQQNSTGGPVPYEVLDPPPIDHHPWQQTYAAELTCTRFLGWDLGGDNPTGAVMRRAQLTPLEQDVARLWLAGDSVGAISLSVHRQRRTVSELLKRIEHKLRTTYQAHRPGYRDSHSRFHLRACGARLSSNVDEIELRIAVHNIAS